MENETKEELPELKSSANYGSYINGVDMQLLDSIETLSEIISLSSNNEISKEEVKEKVSQMGGFADTFDMNNENMEEALGLLHQDLIKMKSSTESFIFDSVQSSEYANDSDKSFYESLLRDASSKEELLSMQNDISNSLINNELMVKTLSAIRNGIENSSDLDKNIRNDLYEKIDQMGLEYHVTGELNVGALNSLITEVKNLEDDKGNRLVNIDSEKDVDSAITQKVNTEFINSVYTSINDNISEILSSSDKVSETTKKDFKSGEITISELQKILEKESSADFEHISSIIDSQTQKDYLLNQEISKHYESQTQRLSESSKLEVASLKEVYLKGELSKEDFTSSLYDVMSSVSTVDELNKLIDTNEDMKMSMSILENNTDPKTNELSTKQKLLDQNKLQMEAENNKLLTDTLNGLDVKDNEKVKGSVLSGAKSMEDLGSKAGDGIMDLIANATGMDFLSSDSGSLLDQGMDKGKEKWNNRKSKRGTSKGGGRSSRGGKSKGIFGAMKNMVGGASKGGGMMKGAMSASKGALGGAGSMMKGAGGLMKSVGTKALGPLAGIASAGMAGYDFFTAEDSAQKKTAAGSGIGGLVGGALGAIGGPLGIAAGAAIGNWVGGKIGGLLTDPDDYIPDSVKDQGPVEEIRFIDNGLMPQVIASAESGQGDYDADDAQSLREYRQELLDDKIGDYIENIVDVNGADESSDSKKLELIDKKLAPLKASSPNIYAEVMEKAKEMYPNGDGKAKGMMESIGDTASSIGSSIGSMFGFGGNNKEDSEKAKGDSGNGSGNTDIASNEPKEEKGFFSSAFSGLFGGSDEASEKEKDEASANSQQTLQGDSVSADEQKTVEHYTQQGMNSPAQIAMATGMPVNKVTTAMGGNQSSQMQNSNGNIDMAGVAKSANPPASGGAGPTIIQSSSGGGGGSKSSMRISDQSVSILAQMV